MNSCPPFVPICNPPRVTVIGAGNVGGSLAQRILEKDLADVVLLDIVEGRPQGIALDLTQARSVEGHNRKITGTNNYADTANSNIIIVTAGLPRKPGMTRDDLMKTNGKIIIEVTQKAIAHSPDAILILVTNPLDVMTYLAWTVSGFPAQRVMGMAGILDSSRFQAFIAMELGVSPSDVRAMVLGSHGDLMVPLPRYSTVNSIPITELMDADAIHRLVERTRHGGAEVVGLLQKGGAYYAPASSVCQMIAAILRNESRILPIASYLQGEYGLNDVFIGVPTRLGCVGVESIHELQLQPSELTALQQSARVVREKIDMALDVFNLA